MEPKEAENEDQNSENNNENHQSNLNIQKQSNETDLFNSIIQNVIVNHQLPMFMNNESIEKVASSIILLCKTVEQIFLQEDSLLDLESPIKICGDIHGQLDDLIKVIHAGGFDDNCKYLFLGDYIDRGPNSLEVICLLFALKCVFPTKVFLIRGNHESPEMAESFGFAEEVERKINNIDIADSVISAFYDVFDCLPLAALINDDIFCVHGGLSPDLDRIEDILRIKRPVQIPEKGVVADILWSDPDNKTISWGPNERGVTFSWGHKVADEFLASNKLSMIIRAHQMAPNGIGFPFYPDKRVITVFSASNYSGAYDNIGAFIDIADNPPEITITLLENEVVKKEDTEQNEPKAGKENRDDNLNMPDEKSGNYHEEILINVNQNKNC